MCRNKPIYTKYHNSHDSHISLLNFSRLTDTWRRNTIFHDLLPLFLGERPSHLQTQKKQNSSPMQHSLLPPLHRKLYSHDAFFWAPVNASLREEYKRRKWRQTPCKCFSWWHTPPATFAMHVADLLFLHRFLKSACPINASPCALFFSMNLVFAVRLRPNTVVCTRLHVD